MHIDSRSRYTGNSHSFHLTLYPAIEKAESVELIALSLPLTNYIITELNNIIYFTDGTEYVATITPGIYNITTLCDEIETQMNATVYGGVTTCTFSELTYKITISGTVNFSLQFETYITNSIRNIIGFNAVDTISASSQTGNNSINLSVPPAMLIKIDGLGDNNVITSSGKSGTFLIYCTVVSGENNYQFANTHFNEIALGSTSPLNRLHVQLIDAYSGDLIDLSNTEWCFTLKLKY